MRASCESAALNEEAANCESAAALEEAAASHLLQNSITPRQSPLALSQSGQARYDVVPFLDLLSLPVFSSSISCDHRPDVLTLLVLKPAGSDTMDAVMPRSSGLVKRSSPVELLPLPPVLATAAGGTSGTNVYSSCLVRSIIHTRQHWASKILEALLVISPRQMAVS